MSQTKVVRLSPGAYVLCVGIVQYFNDVLHWCIMCPFGAEGKKRTVYDQQKIFPTASTAVL